uniref:Protein E6 n=1 Tax=Felis catus papillomavirus 4 TaxID=1398507 RepID=A0A8D5WVS3_9PAPI|nr:E6 protein [Felis catus papillomavirus 4]
MAKPTSVAGVCGRLGISVSCILVKCCFCGNYLSETDKIAFDFKDLGLFVRGGKLLGICEKCCLLRSASDCASNIKCCLELDGVLKFTGESLEALVVRCSRCMRKLSLTEKLACWYQREPLVLVRDYWRGCCRLCRLP